MHGFVFSHVTFERIERLCGGDNNDWVEITLFVGTAENKLLKNFNEFCHNSVVFEQLVNYVLYSAYVGL